MTIVTLLPGESIQDAVNANPAGTEFLLQNGFYYDQHIVPKDNDSFIGSSRTIVDGAVQRSGWTPSSGGLYAHSGMPSALPASGVAAAGNDVATLPEALFVSDQLYQRVGSIDQVKAG